MALHKDSPREYDSESREKEIITTPMTCTATNTPVIANGAKIVWADCDPITGNISPESVASRITKRTKAVTMMHWGGYPCHIEKINEIARENGLLTVEDAAHAMGMEYRGKPVGSHSDFTILSMQAIKHITSIDGGVLITRTRESYERAKLLRWYGISREIREGTDLRCELDVAEAGYKFHMNDICAIVGNTNLKHLDSLLTIHRDNAEFYNHAFSATGKIGVLPELPEGTKASWWLYTIHVENRDEVMQKLNSMGIMSSKVHSRNDTHTMFKKFYRDLPGVARFNSTHLCIPVGWWVTGNDREWIAEQAM
jgi:dTDP-4-amino-4,6-dideoxygalactose transaminase